MALPLIPLLLAKVAAKVVAKKAIAHAGHHAARHAAHETLGRKVATNAAQKAADAVIDKATARKDRKEQERPLSSVMAELHPPNPRIARPPAPITAEAIKCLHSYL